VSRAGGEPGTPRTNAVRTLEARRIPYQVRAFVADAEHLDARTAARALGLEEERVFKTLVARDEHGQVWVFCIPGPCELNLKKAAAAVDAKRVAMVHLAELQALTGYIRGACSPIGMKRAFPTFIDESALLFEGISVSAGQRGVQILIDARDLAAVIGARFGDLT
jgi:Cys-tRNA(Pro)/Cys-tRNA(Cys) deacylase